VNSRLHSSKLYKMLRATILSLLILIPQYLKAQIAPAEDRVLNYRIIGFSIPQEQKVANYTLEIAAGNYNSEDSFKKNIINTLHSKTNKIIAEVPSFGSAYTWRVVYAFSKSSKTITALFHFNTGKIPEVDTNITRLRITKAALEYDSAYVFLDDNKTLYDMNGRPVWYLPKIEGFPITPRDLKLSPQGTITFMYDPPYEINYNGDVLWKAPQKGIVSGDDAEHFHHEFTRLANGHYMVLGEDSVLWRPDRPSSKGNNPDKQINKEANSASDKKLQFGTLIEYDEQGNVTWSWKSADYFAASDLKYFTPPGDNPGIDVHENAFYFDEKNKNIYISFKNISRVLKVKYPEGTVINTYGEIYKPGVPQTGTGLFCGQHACKLSDSGYLYLYDNNTCDSGQLPKIVMMKEPGSENEGLKIIWEYDCTIKGKKTEELKNDFISGGNVMELSDHNIFACMNGSSYCKIFIVNKDKKKLWSARPERWDETTKKWYPVSQYRASIIENRKDLERLIWNAELPDKQINTAVVTAVPVKHPDFIIKPVSGTH